MESRRPEGTPSRLTELREKLGMVVGRRPDWIDESIWDGVSDTELAMIKRMHYKGRAGFRVLPSAETGLKNYTRVENSD